MAPRDDFSTMEDDLFSALIKENITPGKIGKNQTKLKVAGEKLFADKEENEIWSVFSKHGGRCAPANIMFIRINEEQLTCEISKKWRLKNVGYPYFGIIKDVPEYWAIPGAQLVFKFNFSNINKVIKTELKIMDVTEFPNLNILKRNVNQVN